MFTFTRTAWEDSWYGGVKRVLSEYPFITSSYHVHHKVSKAAKADLELSYYQQEKMINIMFYEFFKDPSFQGMFTETMLKEYNDILSDPKKLEKSTIINMYMQKKLKVVIPSDFVKSMVKACKNNSELRPIFTEYGEDLYCGGSEIYVLMDPPSEQPPPSDSDSEEDCK